MRPAPLVLAALATLAAATLAAAAPAAATCLSEPHVLADQRALAALRAAVDARCPCDGFERRGAYQRCARQVLRDAVAGGTLRRDCQRQGRQQTAGASCGGSAQPCGRTRLRDGRIDCRVAPPARCSDGRAMTRRACSAETHCADVVDWTAATCHDPRDPGPYAPGVRTIQYVKDSVVSPGTPRPLDTVIWYPAPSGSGPLVPATGGVADAPLDASGGPYPLVLFSHGLCGSPVQSTFLTAHLATHGFVVVAPPHPGNTTADIPACATLAAIGASITERPNDVRFVLDQVLAASADPLSPLFGAIDPTRIAMTGHSFGGLTTYLVANADARITAAVPMAPAATANVSLPVPSLTILGALDTVISNPNGRAAYARSATPRWLVEIVHAGHSAFSDYCLSDCNPPATMTPAEAHDAALRFILPFLKAELAGDPSWTPLLAAPTMPGFVHAAE